MIRKEIKDLKEIDNYDFNFVIQIGCSIAEKYTSNNISIELENITMANFLYDSKKLLDEILKLGKNLYTCMNEEIIFFPKFDNSNNNGIYFGFSEHIPFLGNLNKDVYDLLIDWCKLYGSPCKICDIDKIYDINSVHSYNYSKPTNIIDYNQIEDFIIKCILIYIIHSMYEITLNMEKANCNYDYHIINKCIDKFNDYLIKISPNPLENKMKSTSALDKETNYHIKARQILCNPINHWSKLFNDYLSNIVFYDDINKKFTKVYTSTNIADLVWNSLIYIISAQNEISEKNLCKICGKPLEIFVGNVGVKPHFCNEHEKIGLSSRYRDNEKRILKQELKKFILGDIEYQSYINEINELLAYSDRNFPKRKAMKLLEKLHSL